MATVTVDPSSPARVVVASGTTAATGAFSPPGGRLLLAAYTADHGAGVNPTLTMADSSGLAWQLIGDYDSSEPDGWPGKVALFYALTTVGLSNITVTGTTTVANQQTLFVRVLTDVDLADPIGVILGGASIANPLVTNPVTPEVIGSQLWFSANDSVAPQATGPTGQPSASDATAWDPYRDSAGNFAGATGYKPVTALTPMTFSLTGVDTAGNFSWNYFVAEIRASPGPTVPEESRYSSAMASMTPY